MNIAPRFIFLLVFLYAFQLQGMILEIGSLEEVIPYVREDSLVVIKVNGLLMETAQMLGSEEWARYELQRRVEKEGVSRNAALEELVPLWQRLLLASPMRTAEVSTLGAVRQVQKKGAKILGVCQHEVEMAYPLLTKLRALDIDLLRSMPARKAVVVQSQPYAKYMDGILFVGNAGDPAAGVLKFLSLTSRPRHVVFVDSEAAVLESVAEGFLKQNIDFQCLRLKIKEGKSSIYLPAVAEIQMRYMDRMLPDAEARWLVDCGYGVEQ